MIGPLFGLLLAANAIAAGFGSPGGPEPGNVDRITGILQRDAYELELLISFGTSKGGSAGHLALAIRDRSRPDDIVHSANFYADRDPAHDGRYYTRDLMLRIPKKEYLFGTVSSLGDTASFGLDYGEIYKRAVIGVRVYGVPSAEKEALADYFERINRDYHQRAADTEYHDDEIRYGYLHLNCAKTIGSAFRYGAGYADLEVRSAGLFGWLRIVAGLRANIPTEMALKLMSAWNARGYAMDVVLYKKYEGSTWIDPHEEEKIAFRDLPNRFPSVLSRDFRSEAGQYQDIDNLLAMYLLYNLGRYSVRVNDDTRLLEIEQEKPPLGYAEALERARRDADADSERYRHDDPFSPRGIRIGETPDNTHLYHFGEQAR